MKKYVIIGNGIAGVTAAEIIRKSDSQGAVIIVTDEEYPFYRREHVHQLISGEETEEHLFEKGADFPKKIGGELIKDQVIRVSPDENRLFLKKGSPIDYDVLLIASGGVPVLPPWLNPQLGGVLTLRTLDDAKKISQRVRDVKTVVIVGAGTISLKVSPLLRGMGLRAVVMEISDRFWPAMFDRKASEIIEDKLEREGVEVRLNEKVTGFTGEGGKARDVHLADKSPLPCDLILVTTGICPRLDFLKGSGIKLDKGVLVDNYLRTNIPNIFAAGDVAQVPDPLFPSPVLHQTWSHAEEQGEIVGYNMVGMNKEYSTVPVFSMGFYESGIISAGITLPAGDYEEVSRFSPQEALYRKFILKEGRLIGAILIGKGLNRKLLKPQIKQAILSGADIGSYKTQILEENFDFRHVLAITK